MAGKAGSWTASSRPGMGGEYQDDGCAAGPLWDGAIHVGIPEVHLHSQRLGDAIGLPQCSAVSAFLALEQFPSVACPGAGPARLAPSRPSYLSLHHLASLALRLCHIRPSLPWRLKGYACARGGSALRSPFPSRCRRQVRSSADGAAQTAGS